MRIKPGRQWLLILALLVGQWLMVAHTHSHPAIELEQACEICVHASGVASGALAGKPAALPLAPKSEAPLIAVTPVLQTVAVAQARIRGPPAQFGQA
ncbi:MAG: hypothetical protein M3O62_04360 [Pseudomonadota bacterium]|nr:hypothetical protein [Pseudomonadota bacterium]